MGERKKRDFWFVIIALLLFVGVVSYFQNDDAESFQAYLEHSSPTAQVVSLDGAQKTSQPSIRTERAQPIAQKTGAITTPSSNDQRSQFIAFLSGSQPEVLSATKQQFIEKLKSLSSISQKSTSKNTDQAMIFAKGAYIPSTEETGSKKAFIQAIYQKGGK